MYVEKNIKDVVVESSLRWRKIVTEMKQHIVNMLLLSCSFSRSHPLGSLFVFKATALRPLLFFIVVALRPLFLLKALLLHPFDQLVHLRVAPLFLIPSIFSLKVPNLVTEAARLEQTSWRFASQEENPSCSSSTLSSTVGQDFR